MSIKSLFPALFVVALTGSAFAADAPAPSQPKPAATTTDAKPAAQPKATKTKAKTPAKKEGVATKAKKPADKTTTEKTKH